MPSMHCQCLLKHTCNEQAMSIHISSVLCHFKSRLLKNILILMISLRFGIVVMCELFFNFDTFTFLKTKIYTRLTAVLSSQ